MRITFVSASIDNSGGFRVVTALGQQLLAKGHDVRIIAPERAKHSIKAVLRSFLKRQRLSPRFHHSNHLGSLQAHATVVPHTAPLRPDDLPDADVVIATWWDTMNWLTALEPNKGTVVHLVQDYELWGGDKREVDAVLATPGPKVAISSYLHDLLTCQFGQQEVLLLPNAVDHSQFHSPPRTKNVEPTFGFVYSHDPRKGTDLVLRALEAAREQLPGLKVIAFGHHPHDDRRPLPSWVQYTVSPPQETLRDRYASCDAWLFGSRNEGFGLPILEAMACRTPVIGMRAGAAADLLGDDCGILLENEDWLGMSKAILKVATMPSEEWHALSERAFARADQQRWDRVGATFEHWLEGLVAQTGRS